MEGNGLLREFVQEQVLHERELREAITEALATALKLDSIETKRRLDELNHAHDQAMENWRTSLPRELFEQWKAEHLKWRDMVHTSISTINQLNIDVGHMMGRLSAIETLSNKLSGALILLGVMGLAGVVGLLIGVARLMGVIQ